MQQVQSHPEQWPDTMLVSQLTFECSRGLWNLPQPHGVPNLSAPPDTTALLLSGAYQLPGGLTSYLSAQAPLGNASPPIPTVLSAGKGPLQNKSPAPSRASEKVWVPSDQDWVQAVVEYGILFAEVLLCPQKCLAVASPSLEAFKARRPGWMGSGAAWCSGRCPCLCQGLTALTGKNFSK